MASIKGTQTEKNLLKAFAGESQARNRYEFFAKVAEQEGYKQISDIFRETAAQEQAHAKRFFKFLEGGEVEITATYPAGIVCNTLANLEASAMGEHEEHSIIYPQFAEIAKNEGFTEIAAAFKMIAKVEIEHEKRYLRLVKNIKEEKVFKRDQITNWKCIKCGYIHEGKEAPQKCPACLHPQSYFQVKEENF